MGSLGMPELLFIFLICLLVFGAGKLPEIGKALGQTIKEFKKAIGETGFDNDEKNKK